MELLGMSHVTPDLLTINVATMDIKGKQLLELDHVTQDLVRINVIRIDIAVEA